MEKLINILIVDDRPENILSVESILRNENINIIKSFSGEEALEKALDYEFALILLDVQMPGMDGYEVAEFLNGIQKTKNIPIIFMTGYHKEEKHKFKGYESGAIDYIYKPLDLDILKSKVRILVELFKQKKLHEEKAKLLEIKVKELEEVKSELEEANRLLEHLSSHDGLTGIPNRRSFEDVFEKEWKRSIREKTEISISLIDIDFFKKYNDNYGHQAGDNCLRIVAKTIVKTIKRPADFVARYGGEEFVVLMPNTDLQGARILIEEIRKNIEDLGIEHTYSTSFKNVTISAGVSSTFSYKEVNSEKFINNADSALYKAKISGRNRVGK